MIIRKIDENINIISKIAIILIIISLIVTPVFFGAFFITLVVLLSIGLFEFDNLTQSLKRMILIFSIIIFLFFPIFVGFAIEKYKINHLESITNRNHLKIAEMTEEFKAILGKTSPDYTEYVAEKIENYVYEEIAYERNSISFPSINKIMKSSSSDDRGRALVGYAILKNLGYNVYITTGFAEGSHTWLRIYEKEPTSLGIESSAEEKFSESMNVSYIKKAWVISSESNVFWGSSQNQFYSIFSNGFRTKNVLSAFIVNLFFVLPIFLICFFFFLINGVKNKRDFVLMFLGSVLAVILSGMIGIVLSAIFVLPLIIGGGLYIRWLNKRY
ncbi:hypothetical protein KAJ41_00450 [Candidatus Parcubacteria bacterium]|nr:hypothetical protein [Candidatus Parcubacteria bacterium]